VNTLWVVFFLLWGGVAHAAEVAQHTEGWCSPAVADTKGNVTVICQGVDPKALQRLNELLDKKDLELQEKIRQAEDWAHRYRDLKAQLSKDSPTNALAQQALTLVEEGKLDEAGALLDRLLEQEEADIDQTAANHFRRAQVFALQFAPIQALPHYAKAYQYRRENPAYARAYADALMRFDEQNR
jgi:tetratricopeptide (TPR) repeat protein